MSLETYSDAIQAKVDVAVPAALTSADFFTPNTPNQDPTPGTPWVTYQIQTFDNLNISPGWRWNEGQIEFQCFVQFGKGIDDAAALAEEVAGALRGQTFTGGHFRNIRLVEVGLDENERWYQDNVLVEFYQDEVQA